jgi:ribose/xylose/arabinose/galactoside ABC-type transport system permease subunit
MKIDIDKFTLLFLENIAWVLLLIFYGIFAFLRPWAMLSLDMIIIMVWVVVPLGFLVLGEAICLITGNLDLSVGEMTGFVGMVAAVFLARNPDFPPYLSIFLPMALGILCGAFNGALIGGLGLNPFLVTLGTFMAFGGGTILVSKGTIAGRQLPEFYRQIGGEPLIAIPSFAAILVCFWFFLKYTRLGVHLYASGGGPEAAAMMGISLRKSYFAAFTLSGFLAGLSALYYTGFNNAVPTTMADGTVFPAFAGAIIGGVSLKGGIGSVMNAFAGAMLLGVIEAGLTMFAISPEARITFYGLLVIGAILINKARDSLRDKILIKIQV